jgi:exodeoxyribonuclease VII small subunit
MEENNNFNIDDALMKLEEINSKLSDKDISLDDSLKLYNEGTLLAKKCKEHLEGVEKQLQIVNE